VCVTGLEGRIAAAALNRSAVKPVTAPLSPPQATSLRYSDTGKDCCTTCLDSVAQYVRNNRGLTGSYVRGRKPQTSQRPSPHHFLGN